MWRRRLTVGFASMAVGLAGIAVAKPAETTRVAAVRGDIEHRVDHAPNHHPSKAELRPRLKVAMRRLERCYIEARASDPRINGVVNTELTIRSDPKLGISLTVRGFDTDGPLGESKTFLACMKTTLEADVLPPIATGGTIEVTYPMTFDPGGVDHRDDSTVAATLRAAKQGHCADALDSAERELKKPWLPGPSRHSLIEAAGTCACRVKDERKARHYFSLASPELEDAIVRACAAVEIQLHD